MICKKCGVDKSENEFSHPPSHKNRYKTCKACVAEYGKAWTEANREWRNLYGRIKPFGMTRADWESFLQEHGNKCSICGSMADLVIDHDHEDGHVRGLVCTHCNRLLGAAKDDVSVLRSAIKYVEDRAVLRILGERGNVFSR